MKTSDWPADIIPIKEDSAIKTAAVRLTKEGYELLLNKAYFDSLTEKQREAVLDHEMAHITRGDLVNPRIRVSAHVWNICTDAVINEYLPGLPSGAIKLKNVAPELYREGAPPPGAEAVWDALRRGPGRGGGQESSRSDGEESTDQGEENRVPGTDQIIVEVDQERAATEHVKAATRLAARGFSVDKRSITPSEDESPEMARATRTALEGIIYRKIQERAGTAKVRRRSWVRPARNEHIAGRARVRRGKIAVCIDVSGSMDAIVRRALLFAKHAKRIAEVDIYVWANQVALVRDLNDRQPEVGCGTDVKCLIKEIESGSYDAAVIVTDGEFDRLDEHDVACMPPTTWVVIGSDEGIERGRHMRSSKVWTVFLRGIDRVITVKRDKI